MRKTLAIAGATLLLVTLTGCSGSYTGFQDALDSCTASDGVLVSDNGSTLSVDMMGETDYSGASYIDVMCIMEGVKTPDYIVSAIESTRALDGRQHDSFDGIEVSWSYHPDTGLDLLYHKK